MTPARLTAAFCAIALTGPAAWAQSTTPVRIAMGERTVTINVAGQSITRTFPPVTQAGQLIVSAAGDTMRLTSTGYDLELERVCVTDLDVTPAADSFEDLTVEDLIGPTPAAWRGDFMVEDVQFEYTLFPKSAGAYEGYARTQNANHTTYATYSVTPTGPTEGETQADEGVPGGC